MYYVQVQDGDYSNAATFNSALNTSPGLASSSVVSVNTTGVPTVAATAPASTGNIVGVVVHPVASWSGKTITFQLQANTVDVVGASVAITGSNINLTQPLFVKLAVPVAKVSGVSYRFTLKTNTSTCTVASSLQGSTTTVGALIIHDTTGVPGTGDYFLSAPPNAATNLTLTIDNTSAVIGNNTVPSVFYTSPMVRVWEQVTIGGAPGAYSTLKFKTTVDTKLDWSCNIQILPQAHYEQKPDSSHRSELYMSGSTGLSAVIAFHDGSVVDVLDGNIYGDGVWRTTAASSAGAGTTASPLLLSGSGKPWKVGDRIVVTSGTNSATNYNECEEKYIKTKNSDISYVLANSAGGAEAGLTYTHNNAHIFNITRSIKWYSAGANSWHVSFNSTDTTNTAHSVKGVEVSGLISSGSTARASFCLNGNGTFEDVVNYDNNTQGAVVSFIAGYATMGLTRFFIGNGGSSGNSQDGRILITGNTGNKTFNDCWVVAAAKVGWKLSADNNVFNNCGAIACSQGTALDNLYSGWNLSGNKNTFNDCEAHATGVAGILFYFSSADATFNNWISGTKAQNGLGLANKSFSQPGYVTAFFDTPLVSNTTTLLSNKDSLIENSNVVIKNLNATEYANYRITNNGIAPFTGPGLSDTTAPNLGQYAIRHDVISSAGMKYTYRQLATPGTVFVTYGRIWGNSTFVSDANTSATVDVYLPGSIPGVDSPDITKTMTKTTDKTSVNAFYSLSATVSGSVVADATIIITIKNPSATAGASCWVGDLLNSENATTSFEDVYNGQPQDVMPLGANTDPGAVSTYVWSDTEVYPSGSKGDDLKNAADNAELAAIK